ncbi:MAG: hypothetical protein MRQ05_06275, partial [Candidatus Midichloria mitochondrii]|nr:hypothetical protein [Candidatus Midichloria mitochondrii]
MYKNNINYAAKPCELKILENNTRPPFCTKFLGCFSYCLGIARDYRNGWKWHQLDIHKWIIYL